MTSYHFCSWYRSRSNKEIPNRIRSLDIIFPIYFLTVKVSTVSIYSNIEVLLLSWQEASQQSRVPPPCCCLLCCWPPPAIATGAGICLLFHISSGAGAAAPAPIARPAGNRAIERYTIQYLLSIRCIFNKHSISRCDIGKCKPRPFLIQQYCVRQGL